MVNKLRSDQNLIRNMNLMTDVWSIYIIDPTKIINITNRIKIEHEFSDQRTNEEKPRSEKNLIDEQLLKRISIQTTSELTTTALIPIDKSETDLIMSLDLRT
jgi:hypothetical protein